MSKKPSKICMSKRNHPISTKKPSNLCQETVKSMSRNRPIYMSRNRPIVSLKAICQPNSQEETVMSVETSSQSWNHPDQDCQICKYTVQTTQNQNLFKAANQIQICLSNEQSKVEQTSTILTEQANAFQSTLNTSGRLWGVV